MFKKSKLLSSLFILTFSSSFFSQKEVTLSSNIEKVTVFFQGAQIEHKKSTNLKPGKQTLVFEKITDFLDPNTIQVKGLGSLTILSVSARKNFEDKRISNEEIKELGKKADLLDLKEKNLRNEYEVLQADKNILKINSNIRGNEQGVKISELKEAYTFIHARLSEITKRESEIELALIDVSKDINRIYQEIDAQRSKPVINYSEILVEVDVHEATSAEFSLNYITPNASWTPYYDLRSNAIGAPVKLEAKAFVNQTSGIEWKDVDLVLSTNDPYQNSQEPELEPWYLNYNNYPNQKYTSVRSLPVFDYSGQKIRGEVIDASTGESLPFAKIYFSSFPNLSVVSDVNGKFEITTPKGERYLNASFTGYNANQQYVNAPYIKFFLTPQGLNLETVSLSENEYREDYPVAGAIAYDMEEVQISSNKTRKAKNSRKQDAISQSGAKYSDESYAYDSKVAVQVLQKDMRVEYTIKSKFSVPSTGIDERVSIATYDLPANYEYHSAPKIDPSVFLVAQVSGWEKLNLLNGESNIYFDGTYIGKSYIDVNSTKDTLSFSLGKDSKIQTLRTRVSEKSKTKTIGSRQKFEVTWEIKVKNNGAAEIPFVLKDQFPISNNDDIKVKRGDYSEGKLNDQTGIIEWNFTLGKSQSKSFLFDYGVDYQKGVVLYLE